MSAKRKLNHIHVSGAIGAAAILGALTGSWPVFILSAAVLIAGSLYTGEIRPPRRRR